MHDGQNREYTELHHTIERRHSAHLPSDNTRQPQQDPPMASQGRERRGNSFSARCAKLLRSHMEDTRPTFSAHSVEPATEHNRTPPFNLFTNSEGTPIGMDSKRSMRASGGVRATSASTVRLAPKIPFDESLKRGLASIAAIRDLSNSNPFSGSASRGRERPKGSDVRPGSKIPVNILLSGEANNDAYYQRLSNSGRNLGSSSWGRTRISAWREDLDAHDSVHHVAKRNSELETALKAKECELTAAQERLNLYKWKADKINTMRGNENDALKKLLVQRNSDPPTHDLPTKMQQDMDTMKAMISEIQDKLNGDEITKIARDKLREIEQELGELKRADIGIRSTGDRGRDRNRVRDVTAERNNVKTRRSIEEEAFERRAIERGLQHEITSLNERVIILQKEKRNAMETIQGLETVIRETKMDTGVIRTESARMRDEYETRLQDAEVIKRDLQQRLDACNTFHIDLNRDLQGLSEKHNALNAENDELREKNAQLQEQFGGAEAQIQTRADEVAAVRAENEKLNAQITELQQLSQQAKQNDNEEALKNALKEIDDLRQFHNQESQRTEEEHDLKIHEMHEKLTDFEARIKFLQDENAKLSDELDAGKAKDVIEWQPGQSVGTMGAPSVGHLEKEIQYLQIACEKADEVAKDEVEKRMELETALKEAKEELVTMRDELSIRSNGSDTGNDRLLEECRVLRRATSDLEAKCAEKTNRIDAMNRELERQKQQYITVYSSQLQDAKDEIKELEQLLEERSTELEAKDKDLTQRRIKLSDIEDTNAILESDNEQLRKDYSILLKKEQKVETKLKEANKQIGELSRKSASPLGRIRDLEMQVTQEKGKNVDLAYEVSQLKSKINDLYDELNEKDDLLIEQDAELGVLRHQVQNRGDLDD